MDYILATPETIRKIRLEKNGFTAIIARLKSDGVWQGLVSTSALGDEYWSNYPSDFVEKYLSNLPDDVTIIELMK